jgi:heterodisulfide reductase subunit C
MSEKPLLLDTDRRFRDIVIESAGKEVFNCYQCNKCSAGCPVAFAMDLLPHQVIRSVLFGKKEKVMSSGTIWLCASCETCSTRCPNEIDIARVMDVLRQLHYESGSETPQPKIPILHSAFLNSIKKTGRVHELSMVRNFSIKSGDLKEKLQKGTWRNDMKLAVKMFLRGKLKLLPHESKGVKDVRKLFNQSQEHKKA